jgi:hypothetical protein
MLKFLTFLFTVSFFYSTSHASSLDTAILRQSFKDTITTLDAYDREALSQGTAAQNAEARECFITGEYGHDKAALETCIQDTFGDAAN